MYSWQDEQEAQTWTMPQCTARIVLLVALLPALVESDKFNAFYVKMQDYARLNAEQTETNAAQAQVIVDQGALVQECKTALEILNTTVQEQKVIIDSNMADIKALNMTAGQNKKKSLFQSFGWNYKDKVIPLNEYSWEYQIPEAEMKQKIGVLCTMLLDKT